MPRFLLAGEFAGNSLTNNARVLYVLLHDRHRVSVKNGWYDDNGEVYIYFRREEMEAQLGISERTVSKVMQELKDLLLVEEKQQGLNKPNKIYLLSPIIGDGESQAPYLDPAPEYNPETEHDNDYAHEEGYTGHPATPVMPSKTKAQNLHHQTRKNYAPEPVESTGQDPQKLSPNHNNYSHSKLSDNEVSKTATTNSGGSGEIPYSQILEAYNELCETSNLRPIRSITGKRKTQTAARFKEYGLGGFFDLFNKVAASIFLCGGGDRGWKADYDWLISPTNIQKVLEGKYDNDQCNIPNQAIPPRQTGTSITNKNERADPFLERAMTAYATATNQTAPK